MREAMAILLTGRDADDPVSAFQPPDVFESSSKSLSLVEMLYAGQIVFKQKLVMVYGSVSLS